MCRYIWRVNFDGTNLVKIILANGGDALALDLTEQKMYFSDVPGNYTVKRANLDGSAVETLLTIPAPYRHCASVVLDIEDKKMYLNLVNEDNGYKGKAIARANLDGSGFEVLHTLAGNTAEEVLGNMALFLPVSLAPQLKVGQQAASDLVQAGSQLTYTLRVTNTGNVDLHAIITDTVPTHVTPSGILTWTSTITAPGGIWARQFAVTVDTGYTGRLTNTVQVTTEEGPFGLDSIAVNIAGYSIYLPVVLRSSVDNVLLVWYDFEDNFVANGHVADRSGNGHDAQVNGVVANATGIPAARRSVSPVTATFRRRAIRRPENGRHLLSVVQDRASREQLQIGQWVLVELGTWFSLDYGDPYSRILER